ncbi:GNAT family N-acetyltransferase [Streptomyces caatingaensis]|uniref:Acetyltransferase n=1 Tax=Streptomyces caatingaensis TaxID=1678637 RepID=A0A0K9XAX2_9ACTN|nr:GNAT family N-acetyltransferase [Streptomyces caatingaensis]KNB49802.1 acetyltransferase [Streptomyces caatingaensis]
MGMSVTIATAGEDDAEQILKLQYLCYQGEAELYGDYSIAPLTQPLAALRAELADGCALVARLGDEVVGSVRASVDASGVAVLAALIVHPRMRRHGLGGRLLAALEERLAADHAARRFRVSVGRRSEVALRLCAGRGYAPLAGASAAQITLEKPAPLPACATTA